MLTEIQHEHIDIVQSSLHAHVTHDKCLEIILVRGDAGEIKKIAEGLMAQKGVDSVKLTTIPIEE